MIKTRYQICSLDIAIVCPTKDQPSKIIRLLKSLSKQTKKPYQIIISESGDYSPQIIKEYSEVLNINYLKSPFVGQVLQRNYAYQYLDDRIKVIINFDDDISLEEDSLEKFLRCWNFEKNKEGLPLGGISFNLIDAIGPKISILRNFFFMGVSKKGSVSLAGYAATPFPTSETIETKWLIGGATGWDRSIIEAYKHPIDFPTRWAVCEDLIYSYPLHRNYRLLVVKDALANHNETYKELSLKQSIFYGNSLVIMRFHFVCSNKDLSKLAFFWMSLGQLAGYMLMGLRGNRRSLGFFYGGLKALFLCLQITFDKDISRRLAKMLFQKF